MNKYVIVDMDLKDVVLEFDSKGEDDAIKYVFSLYNLPPANCNLYQIVIETNKNWNFQKEAKIVYLPNEITESGDYVFYDV
ncbi:MAG: hypothetical protein LBK66_05845 [Spirochaetaceae bacterium]|nr:hypothetical protein [Spirochaetaceae bacterium]